MESMTIIKQLRWLFVLVGILGLSALACALPSFDSPTPAPTVTPSGDTLSFTNPAFAMNLEPGDSVPGTGLRYLGREGDAYRVTIDGLEALKRTGDSFIWDGVIAPGVHATYNLRLTTAVFGPLPVAGPVTLTIFYPEPTPLGSLPPLEEALTYRNTVLTYLVPVGENVPGANLVYEGSETQGDGSGTRLARFSGLSGYPLRAVGDSLTWTGTLRPNVYVQYNLRLLNINENSVRLAGTADLWIME
jgi:hypothetical protein